MIQQEINLNLIPSSEPVVVHCNQYDEGKSRIIAHLYNGSHPYTPGANATVKVQGTKPDNHAFQYWCEISGSTVTVDVNVQMTAVAGRTPTQLIVNETSGVTGSFAFYLDVQASTLPPDIDVSETDLPILTEEAQEAARRAVQAAGAAEDSADRAASWSSNPPYIGANDNWYVYDINTEQFVDSGILARGTDGEDGERGSLWYRGTAVSGKSADPTVYPTGIADALAGDMYLNVTEGAVYHCVTGGSASVATWAYDFTLTGGGGGGGTDNYNDLINQPKINNVTLTGNKTSSDLGINSGIMLSSIMHIGGETQRTVQEALDALKNNGGGLYPYLYIDSEAGATVTVTDPDGGTIIPTPAGSGHWECELPAYGVYVIHSVLAGQGDATYSLTVDDVKEYHVTDSHYDFTINVIADAGSTIRVSAGTEVYTGTGTGSAVAFVVHQPSTAYTIEETLDGYTDSDTVTSAASSGESATVTVHVFTATLNISTTSASLYGKSISIMKGGVSVGSTAFNSSGQATYVVHETGIYTLTCDGYDASVTVTTETTYPVSILAGLDLAAWISAGSTTEHPLNPSYYADFAALEADEEAIRQLMTVHNSVDYLAQAVAGDSLMQSVINSNVCAKWINLRDYALDTLYANSDIASLMDEIDKYGYGEWVEQNIATDTSKISASSEHSSDYSASKAINKEPLSSNKGWLCNVSDANPYLDYDFGVDTKLSQILVGFCDNRSRAGKDGVEYKILGKKDGGSDWIPVTATYTSIQYNKWIELPITSDDSFRYYRLNETVKISQGDGWVLRYCAYEPKGNVPIMTANNAPYGQVLYSSADTSQSYMKTYGAFDQTDSTQWRATTTTNARVAYKFANPTIVKRAKIRVAGSRIKNYKIEASNTGNANDWIPLVTGINENSAETFIDINVDIPNDTAYLYYGLFIVDPYSGIISVNQLQFYGRELKPLHPKMTDYTAPYGTVGTSADIAPTYAAWKAFDGDYSTAWSAGVFDNPWISYTGTKEMVLKMCIIDGVKQPSYDPSIKTFTIQGSSDGFGSDVRTIYTGTYPVDASRIAVALSSNTEECMAHKLIINDSYRANSYGCGEWDMYGFDYSEKEFATGSTVKYIYDHGVELESITISGTGTKGSNAITLSASGATATVSITFTSGQYSALTGKTGLNASGSPRLICGSGYIAIADRASLDVSSMSGALSTGASQNGSGTVDIEELYLE